jgi:hydroxypyruvate reductase
VHPSAVVPPHLPPRPKGRTIVVGAGKAAAAMAKAVEDHWAGPLEGLVITRHGHGAPTRVIEVVEAAHPVPDEAGLKATEEIFRRLQGLTEDDLVLFLGSGGGSSLLVKPAPGITLADKQAITRALLKSGADIRAINCVRKHLSAVKGGRLALVARPAEVVGLLISDVPGNDPASIASGPTVPDPTTREEAQEILARYSISIPRSVEAWLASEASESPKPGDARLVRVRNQVTATSEMAVEAVMQQARAYPSFMSRLDFTDASSRDAAHAHAELTRMMEQMHPRPWVAPFLALSGDETTVTVGGNGRGGRNTEFALALAIELNGAPEVWAIACDTDGIDGTEDNAGAIVTPDTLARARALGLDARAMLDNNDSYSFFAALNDVVRVGPTRTNVSDFRAVLVMPPATAA